MFSPKKITCTLIAIIMIICSAIAVQATPSSPIVLPVAQKTIESGGAYPILSTSAGTPNKIETIDALPSYYSSRDLSYTTTVKYQGQKNICWAFATTSVFEILLNKDGKYSEPFSAAHMDNWATPRSDGSGWQRTFHHSGAIVKTPEGYLTSWQGPKYTSEFQEDMQQLPFDQLKTDQLPDYGVTSLIDLDNSSDETIKAAIMKYGAVWASYSQVDDCLSKDELSYYCNSTSELNGHAITVIGWDDNYPKENFTGISGQPENDGAWLIQNSWGEDYHDGGFFWISYEDVTLFTDIFDAYAISGYQEITDSTKIYQLETFGAGISYFFTNSINKAQCMNVFDFDGEDTLDKVVFQYENPGDYYEIYYVPIDSETGIPTNNIDLWEKLGNGKIDYSGYVCADIADFELPEGKGAIAVSIETEGNKLYTVGVCSDMTSAEDGGKLFVAPDKGDAESYFAYDNGRETYISNTEENFSDNTIFVIKAITYSENDSSPDSEKYEIGDVNMDQTINIKDATVIQKHLVDIRKMTVQQIRIADTDGSGKIDGNDVLYLQKKIVHLI